MTVFHLRFNASEVPLWAEYYVARSKPADVQRETDAGVADRRSAVKRNCREHCDGR